MVVKAVRTFPGKDIVLPGIEMRPQPYLRTRAGSNFIPNRPLGSIYFVHGISARWQDYTCLLEPLAENFRVFAYNQRGHAGSPGKFDPCKAADDLEHMIGAEPKQHVGILAHSLDGLAGLVAKRLEEKQAPLDGIFLIEPYLGLEFLNWPQRSVIRMLHRFSPMLRGVDMCLNYLEGLRVKLGFHQRDVIESYGSLASLKSDEVKGLKTPVGFMLADNDEVLGTASRAHFDNCKRRLKELFPNCRYRVELEGLNHCLNVKRGDYRPFLNDAPFNAARQAHKYEIISYIHQFFEWVFGKT